jgi:rhodanese-related sulfurtransferase
MAIEQPLQIDPLSLSQLMASDMPVTVLDIREPWERDLCIIEGSAYIPMDQLASRVMDLPKDRTLAVVCHHGMRSFHAMMWLRNNGFAQAVNLTGGIDAWATAIQPDMQRY